MCAVGPKPPAVSSRSAGAAGPTAPRSSCPTRGGRRRHCSRKPAMPIWASVSTSATSSRRAIASMSPEAWRRSSPSSQRTASPIGSRWCTPTTRSSREGTAATVTRRSAKATWASRDGGCCSLAPKRPRGRSCSKRQATLSRMPRRSRCSAPSRLPLGPDPQIRVGTRPAGLPGSCSAPRRTAHRARGSRAAPRSRARSAR